MMECPICRSNMKENVAYKHAYRCETCKRNWYIREVNVPIQLATESYMRVLMCDKCGAWDKFQYYHTCERDHRYYTCAKYECGNVNVESHGIYHVKIEIDGKEKVALITHS